MMSSCKLRAVIRRLDLCHEAHRVLSSILALITHSRSGRSVERHYHSKPSSIGPPILCKGVMRAEIETMANATTAPEHVQTVTRATTMLEVTGNVSVESGIVTAEVMETGETGAGTETQKEEDGLWAPA